MRPRYFEATCQCPVCGATETLMFQGGRLVPTTRWHNGDRSRVYHHHCRKPCHFLSRRVSLFFSV